MKVRVVDMNYQEQPEEWVKHKYGVAWRRAQVEPGQKVWRLMELWETTGTTSLITQALGEDGLPKANVDVTFYWPDAPDPPDPPTTVYDHDWYRNFVHGLTNVNGDVGPGMGTGAYHGEGEGGPHAVWIHDPNIPSDICEKLGMLAGTFHDHLNQKFKLVIAGEGPTPPPPTDTPLELKEILIEPYHEAAFAIAYPTNMAVDTRGDGRGPGVDLEIHPIGWEHPELGEMALVEMCCDFEGDAPRTYTLFVYRMSDGAKLTKRESETFPPLGSPRERIIYVYGKAGPEPEPPPTDGDLAADVKAIRRAAEDILSYITKTSPAPPSASPFKGEYFANCDLSGIPVLVRDDPAIDFEWGAGSPVPGIPADNFSVRWTGKRTLEAGSYRFHTLTDDGVRLWVDGVLLIDKWIDQAPKEWLSGPVTLTAGQHDVRMEYYEHGGGAVAKLWWEKL